MNLKKISLKRYDSLLTPKSAVTPKFKLNLYPCSGDTNIVNKWENQVDYHLAKSPIQWRNKFRKASDLSTDDESERYTDSSPLSPLFSEINILKELCTSIFSFTEDLKHIDSE